MTHAQGRHARLAMRGSVMALTLLAFVFRVVGLGWGMPAISHFNSDNEHYVDDAVKMAATRNPNPHWFGHPGSTVIYPMALTFALTNRLDRALGSTMAYVGDLYAIDPAPYYAIGRVFAALVGTAVVAATFALGRKAGGALAGAFAALVMAFSPLHVMFSHMARTGGMAALFGALSVLACVEVLHRGGWRAYLLAGACLGLSLGTRWNMAVFFAALPLAHLASIVRERAARRARDSIISELFGPSLLRLAAALALAGVVFALTTPFLFVELPTFFENMQHELRAANLGADGLSPVQNFLWYLGYVLPGGGVLSAETLQRYGGIGLVSAVLALGGVLAAIVRRRVAPGLYAVIAGLFVVIMSSHPLHWDRWLLPVLPLFAALAGAGFAWAFSVITAWRRARWMVLVGLGALLAVDLGTMAYRDLVYNVDRLVPNTRELAQAWLEAHLPPDARLVAEWYGAPLEHVPGWHIRWVYSAGEASLDEYQAEDLDYVVFSQQQLRRYEAEPERYAEVLANYRRLQDEGTPLYVVRSALWKVSGPSIYIYRLPDGD